jgi:hypothetical protein
VRNSGAATRKGRSGAGWDVVAKLSFAVMLLILAAGAYWTGLAVQSGNMVGTLTRFSAVAAAGAYYLLLFRTARTRHLR